MSLGKSRKHHCVPAHSVKRFGDEHGKIWRYKKSEGKLEYVNAETPFRERHLYSTMDDDGVRDPWAEDIFQKRENIWKPVVDQIIHRVRLNNNPLISLEEDQVLSDFYYLQFCRLPTWREKHLSAAELIADLAPFLTEKELPIANKIIDLSPHKQKVVRQNAFVQATVNASRRQNISGVKQLIVSSDKVFYKFSGKSQFIIGDHPFVLNHLRDSDSELQLRMSLPIAPNILLGLSPHRGQNLIINGEDRNLVRLANERIFAASSEVASSSRPLIESLARRHGCEIRN